MICSMHGMTMHDANLPGWLRDGESKRFATWDSSDSVGHTLEALCGLKGSHIEAGVCGADLSSGPSLNGSPPSGG